MGRRRLGFSEKRRLQLTLRARFDRLETRNTIHEQSR